MSRRPSEAAPVQEQPESTGAAADAMTHTNPFPGPRPFVESEGSLFFGREREFLDLVALLFAQRAVLLHGPSGGGKSSLVHAGLIPRARARGFDFLPVARVRDMTVDSDEDLAGNRYVLNVIGNWREVGLDVPSGATTLAEVVTGLPPVEEPGRVVVFDQFEEIFVVHPERWKDRADLLLQVQAALDADPLLHIIFVLRDDYLARLQPLTPVLRDRLSTRYHLRGLSSAQALDAVVRPFASTGRTFAPAVAEDLVRALRAQPAVAPETGSYEGEDVEPVQLQIVCRTFSERLPPDLVEIGAADVGRHADVGQALVGFYEQAVAAAVKGHTGIRERKVRLWFERQLITPGHTRGIVFRDKRTTAGLANEVVDELEQRRVVRSDPRGAALWYELPHDRLVDAVLSSNRVWSASRSRRITLLSATVGILGVLTAVLSLVLVNRAGSDGSSAQDPERHEISVPGQPFTRQVTGRAGQEVTAIMTPSGFAGELRLLDGRRSVIGKSSGIGSSPLVLNLRIPDDGVYRLEARAQDRSQGEFRLSYAVQTVDVPGATITAGQTVAGGVGAEDEVDVYKLAGSPGKIVHLTMVGQDELRMALVVTGPGSTGIADIENYGQAAVAFVVPQEGTYEVRASSLGGGTRAYRLDVELLDADGTPGRVTGTLNARNRTYVRAVRTEAGGVLQALFEAPEPATVLLLAADGRVLVGGYVESGAGGPSEGGAFGPWVIAPATNYLVMVQWDGANDTPYSLSTVVEEPRPLPGGRAEGELARSGRIVAYRLDGPPGDATILVTPQAGLDIYVTIVQPGGEKLIEQDNGGAGEDELFTVRLGQGGPHLVAISSYEPQSTGRFDVVVTQGR
ncbi:MAG: hypothetical protein ACR2MO_12550 [Acidimicrobiales bacterium]